MNAASILQGSQFGNIYFFSGLRMTFRFVFAVDIETAQPLPFHRLFGRESRRKENGKG
jgi:hypothetical protein